MLSFLRQAADNIIEKVHAYMREHPESELHRSGKMFGVLLYAPNRKSLIDNRKSLIDNPYIAAFSAKLDGSYHHEGFVPPVYEVTIPPVGTSKEESRRLQRLLFANYNFLNGHGQTKNLLELFKNEKVLSPEDWFNKSRINNQSPISNIQSPISNIQYPIINPPYLPQAPANAALPNCSNMPSRMDSNPLQWRSSG